MSRLVAMRCSYVRPIDQNQHLIRRIRFGFGIRLRYYLPLKIGRDAIGLPRNTPFLPRSKIASQPIATYSARVSALHRSHLPAIPPGVACA